MINFSGLGFSFAARDVGLTSSLTQTHTQFTSLNDLLGSLATSTTPGLVSSMERLTGSMGAALDPAKKSIEGVSQSVAQLGDKLKTLTPPAQQASAGVQKAAEQMQQASEKVTVAPAKKAVDDLADSSENLNEESKKTSVGWHRAAGSLAGGAGMIAGGLGWIGLALGPVIVGFGAATVGIGEMFERVADFPSRVGAQIHNLATEGINLTNSLEAEAVGLGQTARQIGAGLGYEGEQLNSFIGQATSMGMQLNVGADVAANALYAWASAEDELRAMGIRSAAEVARLDSAMGVSSANLYQYLQGVRALGMTPDLLGRVSGAFGTMGQRTGFLPQALEQMQSMMGLLRQRRAILGSTAQQLTEFATSTAAGTEMFYRMGDSFEDATAHSTELATSLTNSAIEFRNLFSGVGDGIPAFVTSMSIVGGNVNRAFELMQEGPAGLIQGLDLLVSETQRQGGDVGALLDGMAARTGDILGSAGDTIISSFREAARTGVRPAIAGIIQAVTQGTYSFGDLANRAHTTGRTLQETFDRMKEQADTAFRAMVRPEVTRFVRDSAIALREFQQRVRAVVAEGSPLAPLMQTMAMASNIGALALVPEQLRGTAIAANQMYEQAQPLIHAFTSFGGILDTIGVYIALFTTEVIRAKNEGKTWAQAIDEVAVKFGNMFVDAIQRAEVFLTDLLRSFSTFNWDNLFGDRAAQGGVMGAIRRVFDRLRAVNWGPLWEAFKLGFTRLFTRLRPWLTKQWEAIKKLVHDAIKAWWTDINWTPIFAELRSMGADLWGVIRPMLVDVWDSIVNWMISNKDLIVEKVTNALLIAIGGLMVGIALVLLEVVVLILTGLGALILWLFDTIGYGIVLGILGIIKGVGWLWDVLCGLFDDLTEWISRGIENAVEALSSWGRKSEAQVERIKQSFSDAWDWIIGGFIDIWLYGVPFLSSVWDEMIVVIGRAIDWIGESILFPFFGWFGEAWNWVKTKALELWDWLGTLTLPDVLNAISGVPASIREAWSGVVAFLAPIFADIGVALRPVAAMFRTIGTAGAAALQFIMQTANDTFRHSIHTVVGEDMAATEEVMTATANNIAIVMRDVLYRATVDAIVQGFSSGFEQVLQEMGRFTVGMLASFTVLGVGISTKLTRLFLDVIDQMDALMQAMEATVSQILARLRLIRDTTSALAEARVNAAATVSPADEAALQQRLSAMRGNEMLLATHMPLWWEGPHGYRDLFVQEMRELRLAIASIRVGSGAEPAAPVVEAARRRIGGAGGNGMHNQGSGTHLTGTRR